MIGAPHRQATAAVRRAESAVATHGNGSEGAEAAYEEAAVAVNQYLDADAILHPPTGASSSSAAPSSSSTAPVGRGAANLGLEVYRDFLRTKGKGKTSRAHAAADEEGSDPEADPEDENYEEEIEEEEDQGDEEDYVEVELEVIPEDDLGGHETDGHDEAGHEAVGREEGTHDGNGHASDGEEERHGEEEGDPNYNEEEEFAHEEHSWEKLWAWLAVEIFQGLVFKATRRTRGLVFKTRNFDGGLRDMSALKVPLWCRRFAPSNKSKASDLSAGFVCDSFLGCSCLSRE